MSDSLSTFSRRRFIRTAAIAGGAYSAVALAGLAGCKSTTANSQPKWQIGCYTRPFDDQDYRGALDAVAEAGYKYAGIMTSKGINWITITTDTSLEEAHTVGEEVKKRGLTNLSIYCGDFPVKESIDAGITGLKKQIDSCAASGAPDLMLGGVTKDYLYDAYFKVVAECCDYAAAKNVRLSMKPHGGLNATGAQCRKAIERVGHKNFRIWYDPGNILYYSDGKLDPVDDLPSVAGLVCGMSVKDFLPPKEVMVTPGTGKVKFPAVMAGLKRGGFRHGPLIVECVGKGDLKTRIDEARKARLFLEQLMA